MAKVVLTRAELVGRINDTWEDGLGAGRKLFGIPNGGTHIAYVMSALGLGHVVHDPAEADWIVDDIRDSGATAKRYMAMVASHVRFYAPFDKLLKPFEAWIVFPWEQVTEEASITDSVLRQLQFIGEDIHREGLQDTPNRVVKSWTKLFEGYKMDPKTMITSFADGRCDEMVLLTDIEFYSTCEHHMIPFMGKAHIAYLPGEKVLGVSKLARLLDVFARRLQIQERIGQQVTEFLVDECGALGAACVIEAQHLCMCARGVEKQHSVMKTSSLRGKFRTDPLVRQEFLLMIK